MESGGHEENCRAVIEEMNRSAEGRACGMEAKTFLIHYRTKVCVDDTPGEISLCPRRTHAVLKVAPGQATL